MSSVSFLLFSMATRKYKNTYVVHLVLLNNTVFIIQAPEGGNSQN